MKSEKIMNSPKADEATENAPEISRDEFEEIIIQLYLLLQYMPRNAKRRHFKDVRISKYKTMNELEADDEWKNAPEISEDRFESVINLLYLLLQRMPKNAKCIYFKDAKISEYYDKMCSSFLTDRPCIYDYIYHHKDKS